MINIETEKGDLYSFDPNTERVFKDGYLISSTEVEPIYTEVLNKHNQPPRFSGLFFKTTGQVISLSGKINNVTDPNTII